MEAVTLGGLSESKEFTPWHMILMFGVFGTQLGLLTLSQNLAAMGGFRKWWRDFVECQHWFSSEVQSAILIVTLLGLTAPVVLAFDYATDYAVGTTTGGVLLYVWEPGFTDTDAVYFLVFIILHITGLFIYVAALPVGKLVRRLGFGQFLLVLGWAAVATGGVLLCLIDITPGLIYLVGPAALVFHGAPVLWAYEKGTQHHAAGPYYARA